jgi:dihydroorotase-like cyclic amidohydrolase
VSTWIRGGNVYDVVGGRCRRLDIEMAEERIVRSSAEARPSSGDAVIDAKGGVPIRDGLRA